VPKFTRRLVVVAALALAAVPLAAVGSGAQELPSDQVTLTVKKVVVGTGAPSTVTVDCSAVEAGAQAGVELGFDAQGNPTTSSDDEFVIADGAWVNQFEAETAGQCDFTETEAGGASSTAWTCDYTFQPVERPEATQIEQAGCAAASGTGVGPVHVAYPSALDVTEQASTVTFTNTFDPAPVQPITPAAQVVAQPTFTG
jgi:hypothetical protein